MKKRNIRIGITCALAFVFLIGLVIIGNGNGGLAFFEDAKVTQAQMQKNQYAHTWETKTLKGLSVNWVSGKVDVRLVDSDAQKVRITEYSNKKLDKKDRLSLSSAGGILQIKWKDELVSLSWINRLEKNLVIEIPRAIAKELKELKCDTASGDVTVAGFQTNSMKLSTTAGNISTKGSRGKDFSFHSVAGKISVEDISCDTLAFSNSTGEILATDIQAGAASYSTTSGTVKITGTVSKLLQGDTVSGKSTLSCEVPPKEVELSSVSGEIQMSLPKNLKGFQVKNTSISGELYSDFPVSFHKNDREKKVYGDGSLEMEISTTSASVHIKKTF